MASHSATVVWRNDGAFESGRYSRGHEWRFDGGAVVRASSSPGVVPVPLSDSAGVDPEEALLASASSCHMLWFLHLARDAGFMVQSYRDQPEGKIGRDDRGLMAFVSISLRPAIHFDGAAPDAAKLADLHHHAHEKCFIANSLRTEIKVEPQ